MEKVLNEIKVLDDLGAIENDYLLLCKKELKLKLELKEIREEKKALEEKLAESNALGQIEFRW